MTQEIRLLDLAASNFKVVDPPDYDEILKCTHCGLCLNQCPTYRVLGWEMDSPRGRIRQMRGVSEGLREVTPEFAGHMDACLACRACTTACPASINYGPMVEAARAQALQTLPQTPRARALRWLVFRQLFPYPERLHRVGSLMRLYQRTGAQWLARTLRLIPPALRDSEALLPRMPDEFFQAGRVIPAHGEPRGRVAMLAGCIMGTVYAETDRATVRVLARNGFEVVVPQGQTCCGALAIHAGEREAARQMARQNIDAFLAEPVDAIIINAAGCGVALKEYGDLLKDDPAYADKARRFSGMMKDITEFLVSAGIKKPAQAINARITYQDPCHLAHGQNIRSQPRALLSQISGLKLVEMRDSDRCCGSAGIYNITHPDISMEVLDEKMQAVRAVNPEIIVTANAGCMLQLQLGVRREGLKARVMHVVELLDQAYGV
ncbi:MAG: heterodisulfide reductase-related iron-sulfur binding cluster [Anaerolineae bacterium]